MKLNFPKLEEKILKFWRENRIFEKSIERRKRAPDFVFYEGPPTANAKPGLHHVLARVFKDIVPRYKTMRGFRVLRKGGWDTHGLPVELEIEKKLGLKSKKDIEKYGIPKFNKKCKKSVWEYKKDWERLTERIGFWLDMENPYITYTPDYMETVWWILKEIWKSGLLYQDYKVLPYCPRCGTSLSSHEVAQGYEKIKEPAIFVKFKVQSSKLKVKDSENLYLLVWTTTPWTLPGNVAVAVNPKFEYAKIKIKEEYLILAKERIEAIGVKGEISQEFKGKDLIGLKYQPLFDFYASEYEKRRIYEVIGGDFVSLEEGTGLVHIAPAFGEEDMEAIKIQNSKFKIQNGEFPILLTVDEEGKFKSEVEKWPGMFVKKADPLIIEDLKKRNLLYKEELYEHDYPFCWRCDTPLLYYAKKSWFIRMTKVKENLIKNNQKINWIPSHLKEGRFGEWLKEIKDWALSRERYWGTPLPIWQCQIGKNQKPCGNIKVIGSFKELEKLSSGKKIKDPHRPYIDKITFKCKKCGGTMKRVLEVVDCWFDSGSMPFAQYHYPFKNKDLIDRKLQFPADYISEAVDQTRGWFYTLLAVSTLLGKGPAYKNVISLGHVLDERGEKMSKSKGNVVDPWYIVEKYGADSTRWYFYTVNRPGNSKLFSEKDLENCLKKFILTFWNCHTFFGTYAFKIQNTKYKIQNILDKWVISKLNKLILETIDSLDNYDVTSAGRLIENFVVDDLSLWYIRRSRKRFQAPQNEEELKEASQTLGFVLLTLSKLTAPFIPFLSEEIYRKCQMSNVKCQMSSVHLENWPRANKKLIDEKLNKKMEIVREIVSLALAERARAGIKVRQPLARLKINPKKFFQNLMGQKDLRLKLAKELLDLIKEEVNVKETVFDHKIKKEVQLDTKISRELKEEGILRETIRNIQEMRKKLGLKPRHKILIWAFGSANLNKILTKNRDFILRETKAKDFKLKKIKKFDIEQEVKINQEKLWLAIKRI